MSVGIRYIPANGKIWNVYLCSDGLWRDAYGCVWAFTDAGSIVDSIDRCGIGILSLPEGHPANDGCKAHEFMYSSPAYQAFHTREEADNKLEKDQRIIGYPIFGWFAKIISRLRGGKYWENKKTR